MDGDPVHRDAALQALARRFTYGPAEFASSPLYGQLCIAAADDPETLALLLERRPGVQPTNLLLAAVHYSLLRDPGHPLAQWFPSVADGPVRPAETVGGTFARFCRDRREELRRTMGTRLVQTSRPWVLPARGAGGMVSWLAADAARRAASPFDDRRRLPMLSRPARDSVRGAGPRMSA